MGKRLARVQARRQVLELYGDHSVEDAPSFHVDDDVTLGRKQKGGKTPSDETLRIVHMSMRAGMITKTCGLSQGVTRLIRKIVLEIPAE